MYIEDSLINLNSQLNILSNKKIHIVKIHEQDEDNRRRKKIKIMLFTRLYVSSE